MEDTHCNYAADITLVEDGDLGRAVVQSLRANSEHCRPKLVKPRLAKIERMQARAVLFETGRVFLPREASWLPDYQREVLSFPNARHDDQVDSTSQALEWLQRYVSRELVSKRPARKRPEGRARPKGRPLPGPGRRLI